MEKSKRKAGITTSPLPGTTLDVVKLDIGGGVSLLDTPGLILPHQLTTRLAPDELKVGRYARTHYAAQIDRHRKAGRQAGRQTKI